jgi:hypothetical protein
MSNLVDRFAILVWPYEDNRPVWESDMLTLGRYTPFTCDALKFRTRKEAEAYADSEIRRFRLKAEVRRVNTSIPVTEAAKVDALKRRNARLAAQG